MAGLNNIGGGGPPANIPPPVPDMDFGYSGAGG